MANCLKNLLNLYVVGFSAHSICIPLFLTYVSVKVDTAYNNANNTTDKVNAITNVIKYHGPGNLLYGSMCAVIWPKFYVEFPRN